MNRLIGREPVMVVATVVAALQAVTLFFNWTPEVTGSVNAALVLIGGAVSAALVSVDAALPLLTGVGKAVLSVVMAFGVHVPDNIQVGVMALLTVLAGLAVRGAVVAPVPASLSAAPVTGVISRSTGGEL